MANGGSMGFDGDLLARVIRDMRASARWTEAQLSHQWRLIVGLDPLPDDEAAAETRAAIQAKAKRIREP